MEIDSDGLTSKSSESFSFEPLIAKREEEINQLYTQEVDDEQGSKILAHETLNKYQNWRQEFKQQQDIYRQYIIYAKNLIEVNIGHDDAEVVVGFTKMMELFE